VRALYGDMVNFEPQFKVDLLCNKMIAIDGSDTGAKRRIRAQHWPSKFTFDITEPDYEANEYPAERTEVMTAKFAKWRDDLALFLIDRYQPEYIENAPENIKKFTDEYMNDNNIYAHFCQRFIEKSDDPDACFQVKEARKKWPLFITSMLADNLLERRPTAPKTIDMKNGLAAHLKAVWYKGLPNVRLVGGFNGYLLRDEASIL